MGSSPTTPASLKLKALKNALHKADLRVFYCQKVDFYPFWQTLWQTIRKKLFFYFSKRIIKSSNKKLFITEQSPRLYIDQPIAKTNFNQPSYNNLRLFS